MQREPWHQLTHSKPRRVPKRTGEFALSKIRNTRVWWGAASLVVFKGAGFLVPTLADARPAGARS